MTNDRDHDAFREAFNDCETEDGKIELIDRDAIKLIDLASIHRDNDLICNIAECSDEELLVFAYLLRRQAEGVANAHPRSEPTDRDHPMVPGFGHLA